MDLKNGIFHGKPVYILAIFLLIAALILSLCWAVTMGAANLSVKDVYGVILYKTLGIGDAELYGSGSLSDIVWFIRLPRLVLAICVGAALAVSGVVMQAIVKNPLADPYILGVSSGASLGATLAILLGVGTAFGANYVGVMAFLGALAASLGVLFLANVGGRATSVKLILAGTALSSICSAASSFILYVINNSSNAIAAVGRWTMGSLAAASWDTNPTMLAVTVACVIFFLTQHRTLNLMLVGDESAVTLGTDLHRWRILYLVVASLLVGFSVYNAGIIGFVGLVIPHIVRMLFGTDHKKLLPISALLGAVFLLWADVACRAAHRHSDLYDRRALLHLSHGPQPLRIWRWRGMKLEAKDIEAVLGGNAILRGVSLEVEPNEFVGIIGPNGSGKSTLLKCIYRVLKPQAGIVKLDGTDIRELSYKKSAQSIAVLAQHNYYNFEFSVQDVVLMGRSPHKRAMERDNAQDYAIVAQALETVGMADMAKRSFSTLSGGEQQRVILARALAQQTPCLILDEPTNHLDITYQLELMDIVQGLGRTVVAAIHDLNIAAMYCTRLFVMEKGQLVASGTPEEVLTPELIRQVYGVKAKVFRDEAGILRIQYYPEGRK